MIFVFVFAGTLAFQVGWKTFNHNEEIVKSTEINYNYEALFRQANYLDIHKTPIEFSKISSELVIVNFWASWCRPCLDEMPSMRELKKKFKENELAIVGINADEENQLKNIHETLKKLKIKDEFIIIPDTDMAILNAFNVTALPVSVVYLRGKVVDVHHGPVDFNSGEYEDKVREWLKI